MIASNAGGCCAESLVFGIHSNQSDVEVRLQDSGGPVGPHPWPSAPDTTEHHLALVYDVATDGVEVFVDGSSIGTATRSAANMAGVTTQFRMGNVRWNSGEQWDGILFGVAISDTKLAPGSFVIPEPATIALLGLGGLALLRCRRRRLRGLQAGPSRLT